MQPFFSIVVPVYNVMNYLDECMEALLNQTFRDYEILLLNDGSRDESGTICDRYQQRYPQLVRVMHQENRGVTVVRTVLFREARGKYIVNVDSDDLLSPDALQTIYDYITRYDADVVLYKASTQRDLSSSMWEYPFADGEVMNIAGSSVLRRLMGATFQLNNLWAKAFRRELTRDCWDPTHIAHIQQGEDLIFSLSVMDKAERIVYCDRCLYYYRLNPNSITNNYKGWLFRAMRDAIRFQREFALKWDPTGALARDCDSNALENFYDVMVKIMRSNLPIGQKKAHMLEILEDADFIRDYAYIGRVSSPKVKLALMLAKSRVFMPLYIYGDLMRVLKK